MSGSLWGFAAFSPHRRPAYCGRPGVLGPTVKTMHDLADARLEIPSQAPPILDLNDSALFLDLDGTLAPIEATPDAVRPEAGRTALLRRLASALDGRIAVLSGRPLGDIDRILGGAISAAAGLHGLERRLAGGQVLRTPPYPDMEEVAEALDGLARAQRGLLVERKGASVAIHYRQAPDAGPAVVEAARRLARLHDLFLQEGRMVAELRTPGPDKGEALEAFMAEAPFAGSRPLMIGDDLTDEDAFAAAIDLGGAAILVGPARPSRAKWRLDGPAALLAWLDRAMPTETLARAVSA
jgi:trehalose 6-phosphate phosphatase